MFSNILVPTDGSSASMHATAWLARFLATLPGVRVTILIAIAARKVEETDESEAWLAREHARLHANAVETLGRTVALFTELGVHTETKIVEGSPASTVIADEARGGDYDLLVMASRGLGTDRMERHYLGSVTENVLRRVTQPVLVMPIHQDGRLNLAEGAIR